MAAQRARSVAGLEVTRNTLLSEASPADAGADADGNQLPGMGEARQEISMARGIRAQCLASGNAAADIARVIFAQCHPAFGTTLVRAHRLALGIALADVVAQVRARYVRQGRTPPRFSETLLSAYESGHKRPGPEYLHYLCCVYQAEPADLGYDSPCLCGQQHRSPALEPAPAPGARRGPDCPVPPVRSLTLPPRVLPDVPRPGLRPFPVLDGHPGAPPAGPGAAEPAASADGGPPAGALYAGGGGAGGWPGGAAGDIARAPAGPPGPQPSVGETDDDMVRRTLLRLMADAAAPADGRFFGAAERIRRRMDDTLLAATVSATMLDHWEEMAGEYGRQYMTVPPMRLLCDVLLDFGDVRRMCEQRQPLEFVERLCRLAAQLAGLAGMIMIDVGDQRLSRSFFNTARTAADETGDRQLRAWVAVREALVPLYYGDPAKAAVAARAGGDLAGSRPCVAGVMAPIVEARAVARLGRGRAGAGGKGGVGGTDLRRARAALERAHEAIDGLPLEQRRGTAFGYTERQLLFHQGDALVTLGDHLGADDAFGQAMRLYSPAEFLDRSLVTLGQARCRFQAGEPEEALRLGRDTLLGLPSQHRPGIVLRAARSLGEAVAAKHGEFPAMRDYREAVLAG